MTTYKISSRTPILVLDDFNDSNDNYLFCNSNNILPIQNSHSCCCCYNKNIYCDSWWYYHDTFNIYKNNVISHDTPSSPPKIIFCNYCSNVFECTYKCYSMTTYIECCCFTCLAV